MLKISCRTNYRSLTGEYLCITLVTSGSAAVHIYGVSDRPEVGTAGYKLLVIVTGFGKTCQLCTKIFI